MAEVIPGAPPPYHSQTKALLDKQEMFRDKTGFAAKTLWGCLTTSDGRNPSGRHRWQCFEVFLGQVSLNGGRLSEEEH